MAAATAAVLKESHRRALEEEMKERPATQEREAMAEAAEQLQRQMAEVFYRRNQRRLTKEWRRRARPLRAAACKATASMTRHSQGERSRRWAPSHCLGCSSEHSPRSPIPPPPTRVQARGCGLPRYQFLRTPLSITPRREEEAKANWLAIRTEAKRRKVLGLPASIGGVWGF